MLTIRCTYRRHSKWTNLKSGIDDDDSNGTGRPYGGVGFITSKLEDVTTHDRPQDDVRIPVMELRDQDLFDMFDSDWCICHTTTKFSAQYAVKYWIRCKDHHQYCLTIINE